jgi:mono/diheme cytochrome c family protein
MPAFFNQSNNSTPEALRFTKAEVNAMTEYLWHKSQSYAPATNFKSGDVEKGKELISSIGCTGCHQVDGIDQQLTKAKSRRGPYLIGLGSKLSSDWLVSWLLKPQHYDPQSIMPSFRLTEEEAGHITAFLLNSKNDKFKQKLFDPLDKVARDEILLDYFSAFETEKSAKDKIAKMTDEERTLELGERSIGKYGCYSCHNIEGYDGRAPIGPELTKVGSKPVEQFGFGHEKIAKQRDVWIHNHLKNPRRWDKGVPKAFKDLSKMPMYQLTDKEIQLITVALLGQVSDKIPMEGLKKFSPHEGLAAEGFKVIVQKNCVGCHQIDGNGGGILANYEDPNEGPPVLNREGHRVRSEWLHHFLSEVKPIRPWLKVRMPSYALTNDEKNLIGAYFQNQAKQKTFDEDLEKMTWEPGEKEAAVTLFNNLQCVTCHTSGYSQDPPSAPDLRQTAKRLRPSWIKLWLKNPQAIMPTTVMPAFWDGNTSPEPTILGGDPEKQIQALTKYLVLELGQK